jgi:hypothetical protein
VSQLGLWQQQIIIFSKVLAFIFVGANALKD